ncbi:MAG: hypothetical protein IT381_20505 [Deltaproteobacteria bacterium]|nr:hypothetical protein [Deltaproteobacteria bacterium]
MLALSILGSDDEPMPISEDPLRLAVRAFAVAGQARPQEAIGEKSAEGRRFAPKDVQRVCAVLREAVIALDAAIDGEGDAKDGTNHFNLRQELNGALAFLIAAQLNAATVVLEV